MNTSVTEPSTAPHFGDVGPSDASSAQIAPAFAGLVSAEPPSAPPAPVLSRTVEKLGGRESCSSANDDATVAPASRAVRRTITPPGGSAPADAPLLCTSKLRSQALWSPVFAALVNSV